MSVNDSAINSSFEILKNNVQKYYELFAIIQLLAGDLKIQENYETIRLVLVIIVD